MVLAVWAPDSVLFAARVRSGDGGSSYEALMRNLEKCVRSPPLHGRARLTCFSPRTACRWRPLASHRRDAYTNAPRLTPAARRSRAKAEMARRSIAERKREWGS